MKNDKPKNKERKFLDEKPKTRCKFEKDLFVAAITNYNNPKTFGNRKQAALTIHPNMSDGSAANEGVRLMNDKYVMNEIERVIEEAGVGFQVRVQTLRDIIKGECLRFDTEEAWNAELEEWVPIRRKKVQPTFTERINALKVLNTMDGTDKKASTIVDAQRKLMTDMRKKLTKQLEDERIRTIRGTSKDVVENEEQIDPEQSSEDIDQYLTGKQ